jgi:hypothetical protein
MTGRNLLITFAGFGLLTAGIGCATPAVVQSKEQGRKIDRAVLDAFQRGVTTRAEAILALGEPTSKKTNPADGSTTLAWNYVHTDAAGTLSILALLQFDAQDKLLLKAVSQDTQSH